MYVALLVYRAQGPCFLQVHDPVYTPSKWETSDDPQVAVLSQCA